MKPIIKKILKVVIFLVLLTFVAYYIKNNLSEFKQLRFVSPIYLIPLTILFILTVILTGILNNSLTSAVGLKIPQKESFMLSVITSFYNLITPFRGGMAARAVYLKKKYNFAYVHFLSTLSAVYVLIFLISSLVGIISAILVYRYSGFFSPVLFLLLGGMFLVMLFITFFSPTFKERKNKWLNRCVNVVNGWHTIKRNKGVILVTGLITLAQLVLTALMLYLQFRAFGAHLSIPASLFLSAIGNLSIIIAITPGNLGIQEAVTVFSATTVGITASQSLAAALLGRVVSVIILFILGPICSYVLLKERA